MCVCVCVCSFALELLLDELTDQNETFRDWRTNLGERLYGFGFLVFTPLTTLIGVFTAKTKGGQKKVVSKFDETT